VLKRAQEIAKHLELPSPTDEQVAVLEAPLEPMVVMAGAGSGKSETMAGRVVWLVANGKVRPDQVLGLTFTRKAAAELAARVRARLAALQEADLIPKQAATDGEPTVSTYHAYAARLVTDHALREALEPTMRLVSPAVAWQLAAGVVGRYDGPMDEVDLGPASVTAAVLDLAGELAEHLCEADRVREIGEWLDRMLAAVRRPTKAQREVLRTQRVRERLLPLVAEYIRVKREREVIDHGDQMALAARIAVRHPEVGEIERSRFKVVLLDEYQDTSHAQLVLLRALFGGGHPVTAVGDPCQSIYGWRGASAGNLRRFPTDFPKADGSPASVRKLSMSFRNGEYVLRAAARVQEPLRRETSEVPVLRPGSSRAGRGKVIAAFHATAEEEAEWIAERVAALHGTTDPDGLPRPEEERTEPLRYRDIAVLARKRAQFPMLRRALQARGIPVEVVGLGGLLTVPEVADIVATLRVLYDPSAGDALVRLLTGPRWRIGPRDLRILGECARELDRELRGRPDGETEEGGDPSAAGSAAGTATGASANGSVEAERPDPLQEAIAELNAERGSLVDALDELPDRPDWLARFSPIARDRLPKLAVELRALRAHAGQPLPDLITEIERRLCLDIEVAVRGGGTLTARADLDAFLDAAARFASDSEDASLGGFLAYLKAAEIEEFGLETGGRVGEGDSVKLMTVHAAKGLEWPVVIVPGLSRATTSKGTLAKGSVFPATPVTNPRWTENPRRLPYPLRGDAADLPGLVSLDRDDLAAFEEQCRERELLEERRLAYVAVTRAHYLLIASGYRWGSSSRPLEPSEFLREIVEAGAEVACWAEPTGEAAEDERNPMLAEPVEAPWPAPPAGPRYEAVLEGARMVEEALADDTVAVAPVGEEAERMLAWARDVELLLREREQLARRGGGLVELPAHLSVSSLVTLAADPRELARRIRRPVPRRPAPLARRGTAFHRWLETRWGQQRLIDDLELPAADDADELTDVEAELSELQARFEQSEWADRRPIAQEVPFETVIGGQLVRGRMDAVFREGDGYVVVDWKTGEPPRGEAARAASVQLAAYRLAWADLAKVPLHRVSAAFHYVRYNRTVRPVDLLDAAGLAALIETVPLA